MPFSNQRKHEMEQELGSLGIYQKGNKQHFQKELCGQKRVPALLLNKTQAQMKDLILQRYEVLPVEPLHDVGHHILNEVLFP